MYESPTAHAADRLLIQGHGFRGAATAFLLLMSCHAHAIISSHIPYEELIKRASTPAGLGEGLFGDEIDGREGRLAFRQVDISLATNSDFAVELARRTPTTSQGFDEGFAIFGADWEADVPYMMATYNTRDGWNARGSLNRCSSPDLAPMERNGPWPYYHTKIVYANMWWHGILINLPGRGEEKMLKLGAGNPSPQSGGPYVAGTKSQWRVSCLTSIVNDAGEGFVVTTPDGTRYQFDWMAKRNAEDLVSDTTSKTEGECNNSWHCLAPLTDVFLYATKVTDRFGNTLTYNYDPAKPNRLLFIESNDGVRIDVDYNALGQVSAARSGGRTWAYSYSAPEVKGFTRLSQLTLPDTSRWTFGYQRPTANHFEDLHFWSDKCAMNPGGMSSNVAPDPAKVTVITMTHPSGAQGQFKTRPLMLGTTNAPGGCIRFDNTETWWFGTWGVPAAHRVDSLYEKSISGPGVSTLTWAYHYTTSWSFSAQCTTGCPSTSQTRITDSAGTVRRLTYGNNFSTNFGQLLEEKIEKNLLTLRTTAFLYRASSAGHPFPDATGIVIRGGANADLYGNPFTFLNRPLYTRSILQDSTVFTLEANAYDAFARPVHETATSSLGHSRTDVTAYHDNLSRWVLGQVASRTNVNENVYLMRREFDAASALPVRIYGPGSTDASAPPRLLQTVTYNSNGTVATVKDGKNNTTTLSSWYRGIPQTVQFADSTTQSATVTPLGWVTGVTDENGFTTNYGYDPMGRVNQITYPAADSVAWAPTTISTVQVATAEYDIPAGHWRQTVSRGNYRKEIYFDALWRPVIEREYDNAAVAATQRFAGWKYDHEGRVSFAGYPRATATGIASFIDGTTTLYDALGRPTSVSQTTEYGIAAVTTQAYLAGFKTRVTNPRGYWTETQYQAFGEPSTERPIHILAAGGQNVQQTTVIARNALGNTVSLTRSGTSGGANVSAVRHYVYDAHQRLCKRVEPETGATLVDYDAAGNLAWSAEGSSLTSLTCDRASVPAGHKVLRSYDARNRLTLVDHPGTTADIATAYYPDGALQAITSGPSAWTYDYNKRRLPTREYLTTSAGTYEFRWTYNALGHPASRQSFNGNGNPVLPFAPNALGQPTQAGAFATQATYHPNGALKRFVYGNGIERNVTLNARQLPDRVRDTLAGVARYDDSYDYDGNGNPVAITDALSLPGGTRDMAYDPLDRLVNAHLHGHSIEGWTYDALDNIRSNSYFNGATTAVRTHDYDAANRLASVATTGFPTAHYAYDARGNITNRAGLALSFDTASRLTQAVGVSNYEYDGHGRRTAQWRADGTVRVSLYTLDGRLQGEADNRAVGSTDYIYLGGTLVAKSFQHWSGIPPVVSYLHADALGSPVLVTNAAGAVETRERHLSYGAPVDGTVADTIGFTGHQEDPATGLVYMQQRYYDPAIGRFLSVDPVTALDNGDMRHFNRYAYAYNNPYKFTDPDGRLPILIPVVIFIAKELAAEGIEQATGVPMPTLKNAGKMAVRHAVREGRGEARQRLAENAARGKAGEAATRANLGGKVAGEQVSFRTSDGTRARTDFVTTDRGVVETKTGGAQLSPGQAKLKDDIDAGRAVTPVGKNAENAGLPAGQPTVMKSCTVDRQC